MRHTDDSLAPTKARKLWMCYTQHTEKRKNFQKTEKHAVNGGGNPVLELDNAADDHPTGLVRSRYPQRAWKRAISQRHPRRQSSQPIKSER